MQKSSLILFFLFGICLSACGQTSAEPLSTAVESTPVELTKSPTPTVPIITSTQSTPAIKQSPMPTSTTSSQHITLMAVGDMMLGRTIADLILNEGYQAPYAHTADTLSSADVTIGNLECPISTRGEAAQKNYAFRAPLDAARSLSYAGFDILSLGNNHILDYGQEGLTDTITALSKENILVVGAGLDASQAYAPQFLELNGLKLAFLSYVDVPTTDFDYLSWEAGDERPGIAWAHADQVREGVRSAKGEADVVIVLLHNGYEFWQKVSDRQQEIATLAIDSGASLVIGSHPHVLQRIESYKNGLIAYSMGNFVFDNFLFPPNYSAILSVELSPEGVESYELIQVVVQLNGVPQIMPYTIEE